MMGWRCHPRFARVLRKCHGVTTEVGSNVPESTLGMSCHPAQPADPGWPRARQAAMAERVHDRDARQTMTG